jgi:hypothetical protein
MRDQSYEGSGLIIVTYCKAPTIDLYWYGFCSVVPVCFDICRPATIGVVTDFAEPMFALSSMG